jgi:hypothetical protein
VIEILSYALSEHLNLVATVSRGAGGRIHLMIWSYDKARFLCACAMPDPDDSVPNIVSMKFLEPFPALVTSDENVRSLEPAVCSQPPFRIYLVDVCCWLQGRLLLWAVPPLKCAGILRGAWVTPERDPVMCLSVVPSTHVPPMKGVWGAEPTSEHTGASFINTRMHPSIASRPKPSGPVEDRMVDVSLGLSAEGFVIFGGDDVGSVQRWEVSGTSLRAAGLKPIGPRLKPDSFVERRLPRRRIRTSQVRPSSSQNGLCAV